MFRTFVFLSVAMFATAMLVSSELDAQPNAGKAPGRLTLRVQVLDSKGRPASTAVVNVYRGQAMVAQAGMGPGGTADLSVP